jgi:short-subunit dehydrogenase
MTDISHKIAALFPNLDSVILMAAAYTPMKLDGLELEKVQQMIDVNLVGAFNLVYSVLPVLTSQKNGQIVLCGSVSGYRGLPNGQPYSATKAAIINLAESLRAEKACEGIDVKVINPGFVRTSLTDKNDFTMPMIIEPETAARTIANQLQSKRFEIHFPKKFSWLMKVLRVLPDCVYFYLAQKIER